MREMVWSPDGKYLAISFPDGVGKKMSDGLGVWRVDTGQLSRMLVKGQPLLQIEDLAWTTSTGGLAVLSHPVEITETEGGAERQRSTGPSKVQIWNPDTGELGREIVAPEVLDSMAWGPGADRFVTAGNVVTLRHATSGEPIATFEDCGADDLSWAVAGNRLAAGSRGARCVSGMPRPASSAIGSPATVRSRVAQIGLWMANKSLKQMAPPLTPGTPLRVNCWPR